MRGGKLNNMKYQDTFGIAFIRLQSMNNNGHWTKETNTEYYRNCIGLFILFLSIIGMRPK